MFPISYSETFIVNKEKYHASAKILVHSILEGLHRKELYKVKNVANSIYFKSGDGLWYLWEILLTVSSGTIWVKEQKTEIYIIYKLEFHNLTTYLTVVVSILLSILLATQMSYEFIKVIKSFLFALLLLFGSSYLLTIIRFQFFIKRTLNSKT